jgi:hypothetical protein
VLGDPASNSLAHLDSEAAEIRGVWNLGCAKNNLSTVMLDQVHEASVAIGHLDGQPDDLSQHLIE